MRPSLPPANPSAPPILSVVVCTHEGAERIEDTLWSLARQSADPESYEVVVVDNGSSDIEKLRSVLARLAAGASFSLALEPELGLSRARNRGVRESRGEYVLFIDDDAVAGPRLVESCLEALALHQPDVFGGNVLPLFAQPPPAELDYGYWPRWSLKHFGEHDRWLEADEYFIGTNVGATRDLLERHPFDPELGRRGAALVGGEEWFLGDARYRRRFVSGAWVLHKVPSERMTAQYLAQRSVDGEKHGPAPFARGAGRLAALPGLGFLRLLGRELALLARKLELALRIRSAVRSARRRRQPGPTQNSES